jgi:hypothetical protein
MRSPKHETRNSDPGLQTTAAGDSDVSDTCNGAGGFRTFIATPVDAATGHSRPVTYKGGLTRPGPIPDSDDLHSDPSGENENTGRRPVFLREMQAATFFR